MDMTRKTDGTLRTELSEAKLAHAAANEVFLAAQDNYYNAGSPAEGDLFIARNSAKAEVLARYNELQALKNEVLSRFSGD
jgi:hypothetical protein